jgi:sulfur-oxidizing protein SoxY
MTGDVRITVLSRRALIVTAATVLTMSPSLKGLLRSTSALADEASSSQISRTAWFEAELAKLLAGATPTEGRITLELPEIAENGNFVPVTMTVTSPMTADDYIKSIHLLSTSNPIAAVATFHLTPLNGLARVQSRIRLSKTQEVVALAKLSNGSIEIATLLVKVTIGGCGS